MDTSSLCSACGLKPVVAKGMCKSCYQRDYMRRRRAAGIRDVKAENSTEAAKARKRRWVEANPERVAAANKAYRDKHREQYRETKLRNENMRRARKLGVEAQPINALVVLEMTDGACGICGEDVDPMNFEMDHVVPLAWGGAHTYDNLQAAHLACNRSKGDRDG